MPSPEIQTEDQLDQILTQPRPVLVDFIRTLQSPLVILGAGGKMGPTLAVLARSAADQANHPLEVVAVSRFSDPAARAWLEQRGVHTLSLDLMQRESFARLPDSSNVLYLVGLKFGTTQNPTLTWATNTLVPAYTCERYPQARIAALSSGNVYSLGPASGPGAKESDPLKPPGEYANSCVARERIFGYFSAQNGTPVTLVRLSYALDLRYGVLADIARRVYTGEPVDLGIGYVNCIWQGDANEMIIRSLSLAASPANPINLTGTDWLSVRELAHQLGRLMGREPRFTGTETGQALLSDTTRMVAALGQPPTPLEQVIHWTAAWVMAGGRSLNKPTHFETQDGKY